MQQSIQAMSSQSASLAKKRWEAPSIVFERNLALRAQDDGTGEDDSYGGLLGPLAGSPPTGNCF